LLPSAKGVSEPKEDQAKTKADQEKKKALEDAYKNALKNIPNSNEKLDPRRTIPISSWMALVFVDGAKHQPVNL
jgi:hypothetical protein